MMRFASLGSGSKGNGTLIDDGNTCILIDLGFTLKETERRLRRLGKAPEDVHAVLVTHEHADHIHGVAPFARKYNQPVYLTPGTFNHKKMGVLPRLHKVNCHRPFRIGSLGIEPVPVPHDAREPCQYLISSNGLKIGVLTDLGHVSSYVEQQYAVCHALLLECNHDVEMLSNGPYPYPLKQRVNGDHGHLNNEQAAQFLLQLEGPHLQHVVIAHISEKNNDKGLVTAAMRSLYSSWSELIWADQSNGFDWITIR